MRTFNDLLNLHNQQINFKVLTYEPILREVKRFLRKPVYYSIEDESIARVNINLVEKKEQGKSCIKMGSEHQLLIPENKFSFLLIELLAANFDAAGLKFKNSIIPIMKDLEKKNPDFDTENLAINALFNLLYQHNLILSPDSNLYYRMVANILYKKSKFIDAYKSEISHQMYKESEEMYQQQKWNDEMERDYEDSKYDVYEMTDDEKLTMGWNDDDY